MVISGTQLWQVGLTDLLFKPYVGAANQKGVKKYNTSF